MVMTLAAVLHSCKYAMVGWWLRAVTVFAQVCIGVPSRV